MRWLMVLVVSLVFTMPAWGAGDDTVASRVFSTASPSVVVIKVFDTKGQPIEQGSGVVIAKGVVVSNCHVAAVPHASYARVYYRKKPHAATLRYIDDARDLCSFNVKDLDARPIKMGSFAELKVGQDTYAIGAPEGFTLSLSSGIVSSLRDVPGGKIIQTTTPISPGSSGGGLFDSKGRLIGITAYYWSKGQQLNFALPVSWVKVLPTHGQSGRTVTARVRQADVDWKKGSRAEMTGDYATANAVFRRMAKAGDGRAQFGLAWNYDHGNGVPKDYTKAVYWLDQAAAQGNAAAQSYLATMYGLGHGVPKDYKKSVYWLGKAVAQGNISAESYLGTLYALGYGVPHDDAKAAYWYSKAAVQGNVDAQGGLGTAYLYGVGVAQSYAKAAYWLGKAAKGGDASSQFGLGTMYKRGRGLPQNYTKAFYWYNKSAAQGYPAAEYQLAGMYFFGQGVPQNYADAVHWWRKAAAQGNAGAQFFLGAMYAKGQGLPQNYVQAAKWLILAKAGGGRLAEKWLSKAEKLMTADQIAQAQKLARDWWTEHHEQPVGKN